MWRLVTGLITVGFCRDRRGGKGELQGSISGDYMRKPTVGSMGPIEALMGSNLMEARKR